jgi:hypothetical protein
VGWAVETRVATQEATRAGTQEATRAATPEETQEETLVATPAASVSTGRPARESQWGRRA